MATKSEEVLERAVRALNRIVRGTVDRGFVEVGDYVLRVFFEDDPEGVGRRRSKTSLSLRALTERCGRELHMTRSWLHQAVRAAVMRRGLPRGCAYGRLPCTHQAALLPLREAAAAEELACRVLTEGLTVEVTKANVRELLGRPSRRRKPSRGGFRTIVRALRRMQIALDLGTNGRAGFKRADFAELTASDRVWAKSMALHLRCRLGGVANMVRQ